MNQNKTKTVDLEKRRQRQELGRSLNTVTEATRKREIIAGLVYLDFVEYLEKNFGDILKVEDRKQILDALQTIYLSYYS